MSRYRRLAAAVVAILVVAAGCSSSNKASTSTSTSPTTTNQATGTPIVIGTVSNDTASSNSPGQADGIQMGADYVNAHGGVGGRPFQIVRCDEAGDANKHRACIESFISNTNMVVAVSGIARQVAIGLPLLQQAQMPDFIPTPIGPELSVPVAFSMTGGLITTLALFAKHAQTAGLKKVTVLAVDVPTIPPLVAQLNTFLQKDGVAAAGEVKFPATTTDFTPTATAVMADHPDFVVMIISPTVYATIMQALKTVGYSGEVATYSASFNQAGLTAAGTAANGMYTEIDFPTQDHVTSAADRGAYAAYNAELKSHSNPGGQDVLHGFIAMLALQKALEQLGPNNISRQTILNLFNTGTITGVPLVGKLTKQGAPSAFPSLANGTGILAQIQNGQIVQAGSPTNPF